MVTGYSVVLNGKKTPCACQQDVLTRLFTFAVGNHKVVSLHALRVNLTVAADMIIELVSEEQKSLEEKRKAVVDKHTKKVLGTQKAALTRMVKRMFIFQETVRKSQEVRALLEKTYEMILSTEGKGLLPGFGFTNRFHDTIHGNPERVSILTVNTLTSSK